MFYYRFIRSVVESVHEIHSTLVSQCLNTSAVSLTNRGSGGCSRGQAWPSPVRVEKFSASARLYCNILLRSVLSHAEIRPFWAFLGLFSVDCEHRGN
jgi:hypothetical protein